MVWMDLIHGMDLNLKHGSLLRTFPHKLTSTVRIISKLCYVWSYIYLMLLSHSALWLRLVHSLLVCWTCAGTTTGSRQPPSFTVSSSWRSSKPSKWPSLSPTATSSPQLDQNSTLFRHWKNQQTLLATGIHFWFSTIFLFILCFPDAPPPPSFFFLLLLLPWGKGGGIRRECVGNFLK